MPGSREPSQTASIGPCPQGESQQNSNLRLEECRAHVGRQDEPKDDAWGTGLQLSRCLGGSKLLLSPLHSPARLVQISKDLKIESHPLHGQDVDRESFSKPQASTLPKSGITRNKFSMFFIINKKKKKNHENRLKVYSVVGLFTLSL